MLCNADTNAVGADVRAGRGRRGDRGPALQRRRPPRRPGRSSRAGSAGERRRAVDARGARCLRTAVEPVRTKRQPRARPRSFSALLAAEHGEGEPTRIPRPRAGGAARSGGMLSRVGPARASKPLSILTARREAWVTKKEPLSSRRASSAQGQFILIANHAVGFPRSPFPSLGLTAPSSRVVRGTRDQPVRPGRRCGSPEPHEARSPA